MSDQKDFYATLGVSKSASDAELKSAYRKLAMQYHPDRNKEADAEKKFKDISAAYDTLKDPQKRAAYDRFGHAAFQQGGGARGNPYGQGGSPFGQQGSQNGGFEFNGNFEDLFEDILGNVFGQNMGGGGPTARKSARQKGADLRYNLEIPLSEAATGSTHTIKFPTAHTCDTCHGSGAKKGSEPINCKACGGSGTVHFRQGFFSMSRSCPECEGTGQIIPEKCTDCRGSGRVKKTKTLTVNVPAGVDHGTRLRLAGEGEAGTHNGPAGDLFVFIGISPHPLYEREGTMLHASLPLTLTEAVLGAELTIPGLSGEAISVTVQPGTQPGSSQVISGQGMPELGRSTRRGNLVVHFTVSIPTKLSKDQQGLFKKLADSKLPRSPKDDSYWNNVRKLFN